MQAGAALTGHGPIIQVSVDVNDVPEAIDVARMALRAGVDWLEYGTPLVLFQGIPAMAPFAAAFPGIPIFCDIKIVDGARKYVVATGRYGAQYVSICGVATDASIREAVAGGREAGVTVCADLYASADPIARAQQVEAMGAGLIYLHYGGDQRAADPANDRTLDLIPQVKRLVSVPVGVVTFDAEGAIAAVRQGADIVLIGHPFLTGPDAERMLTDYVERVRAAGREHSTSTASIV
jgi:3-hexulose-6-phosphate synthase/6-phospho-3-hexuloisomerase